MTRSDLRQGFKFKRLLISALALNGLMATPASAELDATTISVAVAQGNAHCLIETKTMAVDEPWRWPKPSSPATASATAPAMQ